MRIVLLLVSALVSVAPLSLAGNQESSGDYVPIFLEYTNIKCNETDTLTTLEYVYSFGSDESVVGTSPVYRYVSDPNHPVNSEHCIYMAEIPAKTSSVKFNIVSQSTGEVWGNTGWISPSSSKIYQWYIYPNYTNDSSKSKWTGLSIGFKEFVYHVFYRISVNSDDALFGYNSYPFIYDLFVKNSFAGMLSSDEYTSLVMSDYDDGDKDIAFGTKWQSYKKAYSAHSGAKRVPYLIIGLAVAFVAAAAPYVVYLVRKKEKNEKNG